MKLRNKKQFLEHLRVSKFVPDLIIDVGAAQGTEGLYETFLESHYILIDVLAKFESTLSAFRQQFYSCDYLIAAVGSRPGQIKLSYHPTHDHMVSFAAECPLGWLQVELDQITIDSFFQVNDKAKFAKSCIIKIDVDGPEIDVLAGCTVAMKLDSVFIIETPFLDSWHGRFVEICSFMHSNGYEVYELLKPVFRPLDNAMWQVDTVFVPVDSKLRSYRSYQ